MAPTPARRLLTRRRDRHGRGIRGPLLPQALPLSLPRAERFDGLVLDAAERLDQRWSEQLAEVEFAVEDVPPSDPAPWEHGERPSGPDRRLPETGGDPGARPARDRPAGPRRRGRAGGASDRRAAERDRPAV